MWTRIRSLVLSFRSNSYLLLSLGFVLFSLSANAQSVIRIDSTPLSAPVLPPQIFVDSVPIAASEPVKQDTVRSEHPSEQIIPEIQKRLSRYPIYFLYIFGACFVLLALIRLLSPTYLRQLFLSLINLKLLLSINKEARFDWNINNVLIDIISVLMFSVLIHQGLFDGKPDYFVWIVGFTAIGYFLKMIAVVLLANVFFGRGEALVHLLMYTMFVRITGLALLPLLLAGLYQGIADVPQLLTVYAYGIAALYLFWLLRLYVKMKSITTGGALYLFLYLCTIEVSPLLVCLKTVILK